MHTYSAVSSNSVNSDPHEEHCKNRFVKLTNLFSGSESQNEKNYFVVLTNLSGSERIRKITRAKVAKGYSCR